METQTKATAKDFFLHLGAMIALYWSVGVLLNLLYQIINKAFPSFGPQLGLYNSISFPVASLIVIFPVFLLLTSLNQKSYIFDPTKKEIWVKRWTEYITLFISGAILLGSLVTTLYLFLDGQELTAGFLLKVLAWLVVTGLVFGYYIGEIREKNSGAMRKVWTLVAVAMVLLSIVFGFMVTGSPRTQRLIKYDEQKRIDLQNIQSQIVTYWRNKSSLPTDLASLNDPLSSFYTPVPKDPQSQESYVYTKKSDLTFELCANFNRKSEINQQSSASYGYYEFAGENWAHEEGYKCFERTIDPDRYPPMNKGF